MRVLVFDLETGSLDPDKHSVFSVGALVGDLDSGNIIESFEAFHKLNKYVYTDEAISVHGITPKQAFAEGITTEEIQTKFVDLWHNHCAAIIGGHNVGFDAEFISKQIFKCSVTEFKANFTYRFLDTLPLVRLFTGHDNVPSGSSLKQAAKAFNIDMSDFGKNKYHTALFDAVCSFKIMCKFRKVLTQQDVIERLIK